MKIKKFIFNPLQVNTYLLYNETKECIIIDPACSNNDEFMELKEFITSKKLKPLKIINTHLHFDHIWGNGIVKKEYGIKIYAHISDKLLLDNSVLSAEFYGMKIEQPPAIDEELKNNDKIKLGNTDLEILHTPGHSPGSICIHSEAEKKIIVGDVIFYKGIGRTDLPGGNHSELINSIKTKILSLHDETQILPGHAARTTVRDEKKNNNC